MLSEKAGLWDEMVRRKRQIEVLVLVVLVCGCRASPWSATRAPLEPASTAPPNPSQSSGWADSDEPPKDPATSDPLAGPDPREMQDVMAQLQELGALHSAVREQLIEDLKQTDPRLWHDVIRQFRATLAYRQRVNARRENDPGTPRDAGDGSPSGTLAVAHTSTTGVVSSDRFPVNQQKWISESSAEEPGEIRTGRDIVRGPAKTDPTAPPKRTDPPVANTFFPLDDTSSKASHARGTSSTSPQPEAWKTELEKTIRSLEANVVPKPRSAREVAEHARLRMLYLLAGRLNDALKPIPSARPSVQDFWMKEIYGLAIWLDTEQIDDPARRAAQAKVHLSEAIVRLGESSPLAVRNLALVTDIQSYGNYTKFSEYKFAPGQEVLLYAEVENFSSKPTPEGYETTLRFGYQIFDNRGQRVAEHEFTAQEHCLNMRRDFFIGYDFHIPTRIYDGKHTLQLTVEDLQSQKLGQSSIEFVVEGRGR